VLSIKSGKWHNRKSSNALKVKASKYSLLAEGAASSNSAALWLAGFGRN